MGVGLIIPGEELVAVTPSDSVNLARPIRALYVGVSGDVVVVDMAGNAVTLVSVAAGVFHPVRALRINSTGTTATNIVGVY